MKHKAGWVLLLVAGSGIAIAACALGYASRIFPVDGSKICSGVAINGIDVGGLTPDEAVSKIRGNVPETGNTMIEFAAGHERHPARWKDLGIDYDIRTAVCQASAIGRERSVLRRTQTRLSLIATGVQIPLCYSFDAERARAWLTSLAARIDALPRDAQAEWTGNLVRVTSEQSGYRIDIDELLKSLAGATAKSTLPKEMKLALHKVSPRVTRDDLTTLDALLGRFETSFDPGKKNRTHNVRLAVAALDHHLIRPRELFSYNRAVGPRLEKSGYLPAPIFSDDEVVQGVGGGVCQVATTVYNAALLAGLLIVSRAHHSRPVTYAPRGRDATVYFGNTDLRFRNTASMPVYLRVYIASHHVVVEFLGNKSQKKQITLQTVNSAWIPASQEHIEDPSLPAGDEEVEEDGHRGCRVTVVRITKVSPSRTIREKISEDYYRPKARVVRVGTGNKIGAKEQSQNDTSPDPPRSSTATVGPNGGDAPTKHRTTTGKRPATAPQRGVKVEDLGAER